MVSTAAALNDRRHLALAVLCLGVLMNTLNATIVNVALPVIRSDLGFDDSSLAWVVNAYLAAFGGCLLLGGRLGDLVGHRRTLLSGVALFTVASLGCGLARSPETLIAARALQGVGGAIVSAMGLSLIARLFIDTQERAKALGIYAFVSGCSKGVGVLLGGLLTSVLSWHWLFLINVPVGVGICVLCQVLPVDRGATINERLDIGGAITITGASMMSIYALLDHSRAGSMSLVTLAIAFILLALFVFIETKARHPLVPLMLLRRRSLVIAALAGALLSAIALAWIFFSALYMQRLLHWSALQTGLVFLPANLATAFASFAVTPRLIARYGIGTPLIVGFALCGGGLLMLDQSLTHATAIADVVPGMLLVGLGIGMCYSPLVIGAVSSVADSRAGTVSGIINTAFAVGGALGLAVLTTVAATRTNDLLAAGSTATFALQGGYHRALQSGALFALIACLLSTIKDNPKAPRGTQSSPPRIEQDRLDRP